MSHTQQTVFAVIKRNILGVMIDLDPGEITPERSLAELGANSIDRVEILVNSMADLEVTIPRTELQGIANLQGLVDRLLLHLRQ